MGTATWTWAELRRKREAWCVQKAPTPVFPKSIYEKRCLRCGCRRQLQSGDSG